ncbi:DNA-dependent ATPase mgs1, partial [Coemansia sp. RSA 2424]
GFQTLGSAERSVRVLQAMRRAGHRATVAQLGSAQALASRSLAAAALAEVGEEMRVVLGSTAPAADAGCVVACLAGRGCTELAYAAYSDARRAQQPVSDEAAGLLVAALASDDAGGDYCGLALAVARAAPALPSTAWRALLRGAGRAQHQAAYTAAYAHLTAVVGAQLSEAECVAGLGVAARGGDAALAAALVRRLRAAGYPAAEHHVEPLWEALVRARRWAAAFRALAAMRAAGFATTPASLRVLTRALTVDAGDAERLADAAHSALVESPKSRALDAATLDAMVAGLAQSGCVEAAGERLRRWYRSANGGSDCSLLPMRGPASYEAVLRGCVARKNLTVAEQTLALCIDADGRAPTQGVYALMVAVALRQFNYEDAFVYLDAMKTAGFAPGWRTYAAVVRRCAAVRDPRAATALAEMRAAGHPVPPALADLVSKRQQRAREPRAKEDDDDDDSSPSSSPCFTL